LSLHKHKSSSVANTSANTTNVSNTIVLSNLEELLSPPNSPRPRSVKIPSKPRSIRPPPDDDPELEIADELLPDDSPKDRVSLDFMKTLIRIQTELILSNIGFINNLKDLGGKVIYRKTDLLELIGILMGVNDIQITTEEPRKTWCACNVPLYVKIKNITLRKTIPFLPTEIATRLQEEFKISLEYCIPSFDE
jgi:hypothetical protein